VLPFVDDFLFVTSSHSEALTARNVVDSLLTRSGLARNPKKGMTEPAQVIVHLGMEIDLARGVFRAPAEKLKGIRNLARAILGIDGRNQRWIPTKMLASLAGKAHFLYLAIPTARFYLRELHIVLSTKECWGARVKWTNQLRRDLLRWRDVLEQQNSRLIFKPFETAYLHVDSSGTAGEQC